MDKTQHEQACAVARAMTPEAWVALHVPRYARVIDAYETYARFLEAALKEICRGRAPLAVVETRAKPVASFAEKILRKRALYGDPADPLPPDPLVRVTDLCGARVICQTSSQVVAVCRFLERAFAVDRENSEDVSRRLRTAEFGYRSVHYVVQCDAERLARAGITAEVPPVLSGLATDLVESPAAGRPLRAEIQVRTLLEHASSNLGHDTIYKTELRVPDRIRRDYASVAAVLEAADQDMERILGAFEEFRSDLGAWRDREAVEDEIAHARVLLGLPDGNMPPDAKLPVAVRAARMALAIGRHADALVLLEPFAGEAHAEVRRVLGQGTVELHWSDPNRAEFAAGRRHLEESNRLAPGDARTLGLLADCASHADDDVAAREWFTAALSADGADPMTLVRYLEFETAAAGNDHLLRLARPMLRAAVARARQQIESRSGLASAWSALALAHGFLGEPEKAFEAVAHLARLCLGPAAGGGGLPGPTCPCAAGRALLRLRGSLARLEALRSRIPGFAWIERFLVLVLAVRLRDSAAVSQLADLASWRGRSDAAGQPHFESGRDVVLLAGACAPELQLRVEEFGTLLDQACRGLSLDLVSGGTTSGISGVAGALAAGSEGRIRAFGYLPSRLPRGVFEDTARYTRCFSASETHDFSPLDPLQAWTDLIAAGIDPAAVRVLCYAPGHIARAECAAALAFGARVGLVVDSELPEDRRFDPVPWEDCADLLSLPRDAMTLRAFLQIDRHPLAPAERERLERAARLAHEQYVRSARPKDPSLQPWADLSESLKLSNYHQVAYWEKVLNEYGLGVRPQTEEEKRDPGRPLLKMRDLIPPQGTRDIIAELAEREHGRWNVERLGYGWKYSREKDVGRKLSPWLIPWSEVPEEIRRYDLVAIEGLPATLREAGLELVRLRK